jgi:thioester reductase-like protein
VIDWTGSDIALEAPLADPTTSMDSGSSYGHSKWIAERILDEAANHGLSLIIIRPAQLCGGIGAWKTNEWFLALVPGRSSQNSGYLPNIFGVCQTIAP